MAAAAWPTATVPFRLAGFRGSARAGFEGAVQTRLLPDPEARARAGRVLRVSNHRVTARVDLEGLGPILLKFHRARGLRERLLSLVRRGRARAEWEAARYLHALGAPVPEPLAVGEQRALGFLADSFFAARFIEDLEPVRDLLPRQAPGARAALLARLARLIRGLHDRGFDHRDLHAGNVLAGPEPAERGRLVVSDLHRSRWGRAVSPRARRRALAQWLHSLQHALDADARLQWLRVYLADEREEAAQALQADVEPRIARLERVRRRSRGKRCFRESTVYTRHVGAGRGWRRHDLAPERIESALAAHDAAREPGHPALVKRSRKGVVTRHGDLVVKERIAQRAFDRLRDALYPSRHAAGYRNAHALGVLGLGTARPLAWLRRGGRTFSLFEDLSDLPRLDHLAREVFTRGSRAARRALLEASADWLGRLHREGVYHGDLKGVNVLVAGSGGVERFRLIDTDSCRFFAGPVDTRRRVKNLAQLAASIPHCVTRTDRMRWWRRYARDSAWRAQEARVAREVAAQLARKIVVVDEPIE